MEKARVLIVDDTQKNIQLLGSVLQDKGYELYIAQNGLQAIKIAEKFLPDLILLDILMPEMDGFETCKRLKTAETTKHIPIIFLTAKTETEDIVNGFELGAVDYITKPFNPTELLVRVNTHLELKRNKEELTTEKEALAEEIKIRQVAEDALRESYETIKRQQQQINDELEKARKTQACLLPQRLPVIANVEIAHKFVPMEQIGGDFYNILDLGNDHYGFMMADVTGHGIPAALISFMVSSMFSNTITRTIEPHQVISEINQALLEKIEDGKFATMFFGIYDAKKQVLNYSSAGHPPGMIIRPKTREVFRLKCEGMLIGMVAEAEYDLETCPIMPGDKVILYTDAIIDVTKENGMVLGISHFMEFLQKHCELPIGELIERIYDYGLEFACLKKYKDDMTLVGFELFE